MEMPQPNELEPLIVPHGLEEIIATFGDIYKYVRPGGQLDPRWQSDFLAKYDCPSRCGWPGTLSRTITR